MTTARAFAGKVAGLGPAMRAAEVEGVRKAALSVTTSVRSSIRDAAPSGQLRMNGKPKKIGASFKMAGSGRPYAVIRATGPLHLLERNTSAHFIPRVAQKSLVTYRLNKKTGRLTAGQKKRRGRAGGGTTLSIPGIGFRKSVTHPGTTGKRPFERGVSTGSQQAGRIVLAEVSRGLTAALR